MLPSSHLFDASTTKVAFEKAANNAALYGALGLGGIGALSALASKKDRSKKALIRGLIGASLGGLGGYFLGGGSSASVRGADVMSGSLPRGLVRGADVMSGSLPQGLVRGQENLPAPSRLAPTTTGAPEDLSRELMDRFEPRFERDNPFVVGAGGATEENSVSTSPNTQLSDTWDYPGGDEELSETQKRIIRTQTQIDKEKRIADELKDRLNRHAEAREKIVGKEKRDLQLLNLRADGSLPKIGPTVRDRSGAAIRPGKLLPLPEVDLDAANADLGPSPFEKYLQGSRVY